MYDNKDYDRLETWIVTLSVMIFMIVIVIGPFLPAIWDWIVYFWFTY